MFPLGIAWVVISPYLVGIGVAHLRPLNRVVTLNLTLVSVLGWTAVLVLAGAVLGDVDGMTALIAAPFAGLAFWVRGPSDDDDDEAPPEPPNDPPPATAKRFQQPPRRVRPSHGDGRSARKHAPRERATR